MKLLLADKFEQVGRDALDALGCSIESQPGLTADELPAAVASSRPDILVVRSTRVSAAAIEACPDLKLIIRAGAGYDTIDVNRASAEGIYVANCPGKNAIAVAELAWALILSCDRRVPDQTAELRAGSWNKQEFSKAEGLFGSTLGILGFGTIGREVATRAKAFGMNIVAWSRSLTDELASELGVRRASTPLDVARQADVLSVHVASTPDTRHLVSAEIIDAMKPGAYLINTSRGAVVNETELLRGIETKQLRAGLDVYGSEPGSGTASFDSALASAPGVYGTHHVGASTSQAQQAIALEAVRIVKQFMDTGEVVNCVNRARKSSATCLLTVRHRNRPGVLAKVFDVLSESGINVEEMENILYEGHEAACARIQLASAPSSSDLSRLRSTCDDILGLELAELARAS